MGARLLDGLQGLVDEFPNIDNARGVGLMAGIDVVASKESRTPDSDTATAIGNHAMDMGLRARPIVETIAFSPPLCITAEEVGYRCQYPWGMRSRGRVRSLAKGISSIVA